MFPSPPRRHWAARARIREQANYLVSETTHRGLIIKAQSGFFTVETGQGLVVCQLRGKLKRGRAMGDLAAIGDRVRITMSTDGSGAIEEVEQRKQAIVRLDPRPQGEYQ